MVKINFIAERRLALSLRFSPVAFWPEVRPQAKILLKIVHGLSLRNSSGSATRGTAALRQPALTDDVHLLTARHSRYELRQFLRWKNFQQ